MFLKQAKILCPNIVILPYNFALYKQVSADFYESIRDITSEICPVSCDEVYLKLNGIVEEENYMSFLNEIK